MQSLYSPFNKCGLYSFGIFVHLLSSSIKLSTLSNVSLFFAVRASFIAAIVFTFGSVYMASIKVLSTKLFRLLFAFFACFCKSCNKYIVYHKKLLLHLFCHTWNEELCPPDFTGMRIDRFLGYGYMFVVYRL